MLKKKFSFSASLFWIMPHLSSWSTNKLGAKKPTSEVSYQPQCINQVELLFLSSDLSYIDCDIQN